MPSGRKAPKPIEAPKAKSQFKGINQTSFSSGFGSGTSKRNQVMDVNGKPVKGQMSLDTNTQLADFLQPIPSMAGGGVQSNINYLGRSPQQQYQDAIGGNDPYYNFLKQQTDTGVDKAIGRSMVDNSGLGTRNSTTAGAARGTILNDALMRDNSNLLQSIQFGNQQATSNLGANLNTLGSLANLTYPLGAAANANLTQGYGAQDSMAQSNAALQMQANQINTAAQNQYEEWKRQNGFGGIMSQLSPVYGFASGNGDLAMRGLAQGAQLAGTIAGGMMTGGASLAAQGAAKGLGAMGNGGGFNLQQGLYQPKFEQGIF